MKHPILIAGALAFGVALAGAAAAQPPPGGGPPGGGIRQACAADIQKACPDAHPGRGGGMRECIQAHFSDFSQPCQQAIMAMRQRMQQQQQQGGPPPNPPPNPQ